MTEPNIFALGLGIESPWKIENQHLDTGKHPHELHLRIAAERGARYPCPKCNTLCQAHDFKEFTWRHLNFFQHHCYVTAPVPRTNCEKCGVLRVKVPWAREGNAFTLLFESVVLTLAREMPVAALARYVGETDKRLWRIIEHYVGKAVQALDLSGVEAIALDETACKRGHNYVTVFIDMERKEKPVIFVTEGKGKETVERFKAHLLEQGGEARRVLEVVCDMSGAFIAAVEEHFVNASVTVDWFHVVQMFTKALDEVRRKEAKLEKLPKGLRFALLKRPEKLTEHQREALADLQSRNLATAEAYRCKENLAWVREAPTPQAAAWRMTNFVKDALQTLKGAVFEPMRKALKTLMGYRTLILRRWRSTYSNARLEGFNGLFKAARARARGYRNTDTFKTMIYLIGAPLGDILDQLAKPFCQPNST